MKALVTLLVLSNVLLLLRRRSTVEIHVHAAALPEYEKPANVIYSQELCLN